MKHYNDQAVMVAERFMSQHGGEHLDRDRQLLLDRCAEHLSEVFAMSRRAGMEIAVLVWGRLADGEGSDWRLDAERSTPEALVLVRRGSDECRVFSVREVVNCLEPRERWIGIDWARGEKPGAG